jgi:ABC-type multidrug transport system fused ATPase/permease subunit
MKWLSRLELKYGRYAIRNLAYYIVGLNLAVLLPCLFIFKETAILYLSLIPQMVFKGEVWRILTFIFLPESMNLFVALLSVYVTYFIGTAIESYWGKARFNAYYFCGVLLTIIAGFVSGFGYTGFYLNMSLFLAFATLFPEQELMLFFILPVKAKYLGVAEVLFVLYQIFTTLQSGVLFWPMIAAILASFVNYFIFFGSDINKWIRLKRQVAKNRKRFFDQVRPYNRNRPPY